MTDKPEHSEYGMAYRGTLWVLSPSCSLPGLKKKKTTHIPQEYVCVFDAIGLGFSSCHTLPGVLFS